MFLFLLFLFFAAAPRGVPSRCFFIILFFLLLEVFPAVFFFFRRMDGLLQGEHQRAAQELLLFLAARDLVQLLQASQRHSELGAAARCGNFDFQTPLTDAGLGYFVGRCRNLQRVILRGCCDLTDEAAKHLAGCCKDLQEVDFWACINLTDAAAERLAEGCKSLRQVQFASCWKLTDRAAQCLAEGCKLLQQVQFANCESFTDEGGAVPGGGLQGPARGHLRLVSGAHGPRGAAPGWGLQQLGGGGNLTDRAVEYLAEGCPSLRRVGLRCCNHLTEAAAKHLHALPGCRLHWHGNL